MKNFLFSIFLLALCSTLAYSQDDFKPEVKVGALIYTGWQFNMDNANFITKLDTTSPNSSAAFGFNPTKFQFETSQNSFYLERAYINIVGLLTKDIKARVTPDVISFKDQAGTTQYALGFKYANITYTPLIKDNGMSLGFSVGIIPNKWIQTNENYWVYRGIAKTLTDYSWITGASVGSGLAKNTVTVSTGSYFSSADLGLGIGFTAPKGYAEIDAEILNGNGYRNLNFDNRFKDILVSGFFHPLQGQITKKMDAMKKAKKDRITGIADLTVGGFMYLGKLTQGENTQVNPATGQVATQFQRNRFGGMASLKLNFKTAGFVRLGGEYSMISNQDPAAKIDSIAQTKSTGLSVYLELNPPVKSLNEKLMLIARYDMFDPNTDNSSTSTTSFNNNTDKQSLLILGLAFKPNKVLTLGVSYQATTYQSEYIVKYDGTTSKTDSKLIVHGIIGF